VLFRAFGLGASMLSNGNPPPKPLNPGPVFGFGLLVVIGIVALSGYERHLTVGLLIIAPLVCAALVLVGAITHSTATSVPTDSHDKLRRMKQLYALLSADCPVCKALPGITCIAGDDKPYAIVDTQWNTLCHFARMEKAVRYHMVSRADMIAQFGGNAPEGLNL
jgi:hypothetical protein